MTRHPMTSFLVIAYPLMWGAWMPVIFFDAPPRPMSTLGALLGLAVPAFAVTSLTQGREGVRDLARRSLRWRVGMTWYLVAVFAIPAGTLLLATFAFGTTTLNALASGWAGTLSGFVLNVALALLTVQLFEEIGWSGFVQHHVQTRHGALRGTIVVALAFAMIHLPTYFTAPISGSQTVAVLAQMVPLLVIAVCLRILFTWMYNRTAFSVLLVAVFHASLNTASSSEFYAALGADAVAMMLPLAVVALLAFLVAFVSRGKLGYTKAGRS